MVAEAPTGALAGIVRRQRPVLHAVLFAAAYLLLGLAWLGSNPPGAAPDEQDHLTKALGMARLDIGVEYTGPPLANNPVGIRNASISRVVEIPAQLNPEGFNCTAHEPRMTAACLPTAVPPGGDSVDRITPVGAYPPFVYILPGLAADGADSPGQAFLAARFVFLLLAVPFLFLGAWHVLRWLGAPSLLGAFVGFTPMAVFASAMVSTSGLEIATAFTVAAVAVVAIRRPESLTAPATYAILAISAATLAFSRQMGALTVCLLIAVIAVRTGWARGWRVLRARRGGLIISLGVVLAAGVTVAGWEIRYDHPSDTGSPTDTKAVGSFLQPKLMAIVRSAVGNFGWLDTLMPEAALAVWLCALVFICGAGLLLADRADRWTLLAVMVACLITAYVIFAIVFYPIQANLQGRHMLPMLILVPLLAGIIIVEKLTEAGWRDRLHPLFIVLGILVATLHGIALYFNARRYAVGIDGPIWFFGASEWRPQWGWWPWILLGLAGCALLVTVTFRARHADPPSLPRSEFA